ncbi:MAG: S-layer homology domain-containing protein [Rubrobacteridae bacterium]|nr:S-layer homology domain-containing protein [Rubrobacteridae bacterium]
MTRSEIAKIIAEAKRLPAGACNLSDVRLSWAKAHIGACVKAGLMNGYTDNSFKPDQNATRAEAAKILSGII